MVKIKICGLSRPCDIDAVNLEKPDYIGFVFADSRRRVTPKQAAELRDRLHPDIVPVGVFVDEPTENILYLIETGVIDAVQLHGSENEDYIKKLKALTDKPIIKAVAVESKGDAQKREATAADYLLLDSKGGGTGRLLNRSLIGQINRPYFLAGGLDFDTVTRAIEETYPYAVDVSSGVETDGFKDPKKIKDFIRRVRNGG